MARVFHNSEWYDELGAGSLYEKEFERILLQYLGDLCPGHVAVPFKKTVLSTYGAARADLALVQTNYLSWWVVEVELTTHSLEGHVLPQVTRLADAAYERGEADYLAEKSDQLDRQKLREMLRGDQPRVLVIADARRAEWEKRLAGLGARLAAFQLFRSERGVHLVLTDGYWPTLDPETRSSCHVHPAISKFLVVSKPAILPRHKGNRISIHYHGKLTDWQRVDTADQVSLMPLVNVTLDPQGSFELVATSGLLRLENL